MKNGTIIRLNIRSRNCRNEQSLNTNAEMKKNPGMDDEYNIDQYNVDLKSMV